MWKLLVGMVVMYEALQQAVEVQERRVVFTQAREYADSTGKPLLVVGIPKFQNHPCGDVNIDINPEWAARCDGEVADIRDIPYPDKHFAAAYCSHVLEHLGSIEDVRQALGEMERVADRAYIVVPHKPSIAAWLWPEHHLWVTPIEGGYHVEERHTGITDYVLTEEVRDGQVPVGITGV